MKKTVLLFHGETKKLKSRLSLSQQKLSLTVKSGIATKPNMVFDYNISMTGCDKADQNIAYYGVHERR